MRILLPSGETADATFIRLLTLIHHGNRSVEPTSVLLFNLAGKLVVATQDPGEPPEVDPDRDTVTGDVLTKKKRGRCSTSSPTPRQRRA